MKAFLISAACMIILLASWWVFSDYADNTLHDLMEIGEKEIAPAIEQENWPKAEQKMKAMTERWHESKKVYSFFYRTSDINETDYSMAKAEKFILAEDVSNASGEISCIMEELKFLHGNETMTLENLF